VIPEVKPPKECLRTHHWPQSHRDPEKKVRKKHRSVPLWLCGQSRVLKQLFRTALAGLLLGLFAGAQERQRAPFEPDSPLGRKEHPRLLVTRAMLPGLRERCRTVYAEDYQRMTRWADQELLTLASKDWKDGTGLTNEEVRRLLALAFLWQVSRERRYADAAMKAMEAYAGSVAARSWTDSQTWRTGTPTGYVPQRFFCSVAVIYDLLHDAMTPERREAVGRRILEGVAGRRNVPGMGYALASFLGVGKAAGVLSVHGDGFDDESASASLKDLFRYLDEQFFPDHRFVSRRRGGWMESLHCGCFEEYWLPFFWFLSNATGRNLFRAETVLRGMGTWYVYNIFRFGPGPDSNVVPVSSIDHGGVGTKGAHGMPVCAAASGDGLSAWLIRQPWWQENRGLRLDRLPPEDAWFKILFVDPSAEQVAPEQLPETALFEGIGWVSMRGSWKGDAAFAHFKCGHWRRGEPAHLDNNSFFIYKNGPLAIDGIKPGTIDDPAHPGTPLEKLVPYGRMTIAHNTITVYDPDEKIMGVSQYQYKEAKDPFPVNDGGQTFRREKRADRPTRLEQGRIVAYETHRLFDYVCGDATESYHPKKLRQFTRQFVFIKPDVFVVFDRVESTNAEFPKHWLLHSYREPRISGDTATIDAPGDDPRGGRLFSRTLLPDPAKIAKVPRATLVRLGRDLTPDFWKNTEDSWRIEVEPSTPRENDVFLHVLHAADRAAAEMIPTERIDREGQAGVRLSSGGRQFDLLFARTGGVAGRIRIVDGNRTILDRDLADGIRDTYEGWREDPRYPQWMADPRLRRLIGLGE